MHAHQGEIHIFLPETEVHVVLPHGGSGTGHVVRKEFFGSLQVAVLQAYTAALLQSLIGLGRPSRIDADRIEGTLRRRVLESMNKTVSSTQQHNQHKDAPCHGKPCKERTQLVSLYRAVYFLKDI